jgi:hypothetical protein
MITLFNFFTHLTSNFVQMLDFNKTTCIKKEGRQKNPRITYLYIFLPLLLIQPISFDVVRPTYGLTSENYN